MIQLADRKLCTGCGACAFKCPHSCIMMKEDDIGQVMPMIDADACVECHACQRICPVLNSPSVHDPQEAYAAWSLDEVQRVTSASGGVAYELYKNALEQGCIVIGASFNSDFSVSLKIGKTPNEIYPFKNSKYVFSTCYKVYPEIEECLKRGEQMLVMGVPCQIAAMRNLYARYKNILYVEILCHGMTPYSYLRQHVDVVEADKGRKAYSMSFRAPEFDTATYTFSLYDEVGDCFYSARTIDGDTYQYGFHRGVTYRESCYQCSFAQPKRSSDIVLCDFYGLGAKKAFTHDKHNVSCVIVNTVQGMTFFQSVVNKGRLFIEKRPLEEAVAGNPRLQHPNNKTKDRLVFEKRIVDTEGDFEKAITPLAVHYLKEVNRPIWWHRCQHVINCVKGFLK